MKTNIYDINEDFKYLYHEFKKDTVIEIVSLDTLLIHTTEKDRIISTTPMVLNAYCDVVRSDFYDATRFIYDTRKHISIRNYPKAWR